MRNLGTYRLPVGASDCGQEREKCEDDTCVRCDGKPAPYVLGAPYSAEIQQGKELPKFNYEIPTQFQNEFALRRLFTPGLKRELDLTHRRADKEEYD